MGYTFVTNDAYLNSIFNSLNAINDEISTVGQQKHNILEIEPSDFLEIFLRF